jgi:hypothetical protein
LPTHTKGFVMKDIQTTPRPTHVDRAGAMSEEKFGAVLDHTKALVRQGLVEDKSLEHEDDVRSNAETVLPERGW